MSVAGGERDSFPDGDSARNIIVQGMVEGLRELGEDAATSTLFFIKTRGGVELEEIPDNPEKLCHTLREIFGVGSGLLMRSIRDKIRERLHKANEHERGHVTHFISHLDRCIASVEAGIV